MGAQPSSLASDNDNSIPIDDMPDGCDEGMTLSESPFRKRWASPGKTTLPSLESYVSMGTTLTSPFEQGVDKEPEIVIAPAAENDHCLKSIDNSIPTKITAGQFSILPPHLCLYLLKYHLSHLPTAYSLAKTCKYWYSLFNDESIFRLATQRRFGVDTTEWQIRLMHESLETSWKDVYLRLDQGQTSWKGFAIDRATNNFLPYPMEIVISQCCRTRDKKTRGQGLLKSEFHGICRWESVHNSMTKLQGAIFDPTTPQDHRFAVDTFLHTAAPRTCTFTETSIIRGDDIAIPNNYFGMMVGPLLLGMYDPGHPQFLGCFILMMEEALASKSMVSHVEKTIWAKRNQSDQVLNPCKNITKQVLNEILHSKESEPDVYIPSDKSERTRRLQVMSSNRSKRSFLQEKGVYRGILTHATEGDKKGFHVEWEVLSATQSQVHGIFSIMLVSCKNGNLSTMKTSPCKIKLSIDIHDSNDLDEFVDTHKVLQGLNDTTHTSFPTDSYMASSAELYTHFKNPIFTRLRPSNESIDETSLSEDELIENEWLQDHIPIDSNFTLIRLGGILAGFLNEPKVGVFYLNIQ